MVFCPICESRETFAQFGVNARPNALCVNCRSLERDRALWMYLESRIKSGDKILHIAPESSLFMKLKTIGDIDYYPVDINPRYRGIRHVVDVCRLPYPDNYFDIIICCNVLEEVPNDIMALSNLKRVLKNDGQAIINSFVKWAKSTEEIDLSIKYENIPYYGVKRRQYGRDYIARIESVGFKTYIIEQNKSLSEKELKEKGLIKDEKIIVCRTSN